MARLSLLSLLALLPLGGVLAQLTKDQTKLVKDCYDKCFKENCEQPKEDAANGVPSGLCKLTECTYLCKGRCVNSNTVIVQDEKEEYVKRCKEGLPKEPVTKSDPNCVLKDEWCDKAAELEAVVEDAPPCREPYVPYHPDASVPWRCSMRIHEMFPFLGFVTLSVSTLGYYFASMMYIEIGKIVTTYGCLPMCREIGHTIVAAITMTISAVGSSNYMIIAPPTSDLMQGIIWANNGCTVLVTMFFMYMRSSYFSTYNIPDLPRWEKILHYIMMIFTVYIPFRNAVGRNGYTARYLGYDVRQMDIMRNSTLGWVWLWWLFFSYGIISLFWNIGVRFKNKDAYRLITGYRRFFYYVFALSFINLNYARLNFTHPDFSNPDMKVPSMSKSLLANLVKYIATRIVFFLVIIAGRKVRTMILEILRDRGIIQLNIKSSNYRTSTIAVVQRGVYALLFLSLFNIPFFLNMPDPMIPYFRGTVVIVFFIFGGNKLMNKSCEGTREDWIVAGRTRFRENEALAPGQVHRMLLLGKHLSAWAIPAFTDITLLVSVVCQETIWPEKSLMQNANAMKHLNLLKFLDGLDPRFLFDRTQIIFNTLLYTYMILAVLNMAGETLKVPATWRSSSVWHLTTAIIFVAFFIGYNCMLLFSFQFFLAVDECKTIFGFEGDRVAIVPAIVCDDSETHRFVLHMLMFVLLFFIIMPAYNFLTKLEGSNKPLMSRRTNGVALALLSRFVLISAMRWYGVDTTLYAGFIFLSIFTTNEWVHQTVGGHPRINAIMFAIYACLLWMCIVGILSYTKNTDWTPFMLLWTQFPFLAHWSYHMRLRLAKRHGEEVCIEIRSLVVYPRDWLDKDALQLEPWVVGVGSHTRLLGELFLQNLSLKTRDVLMQEQHSSKSMESVREMLVLARHFLTLMRVACGTDIGLRAFQLNMPLCSLPLYFLDVHCVRAEAISALYPLVNLPASRLFLRDVGMDKIIKCWGSDISMCKETHAKAGALIKFMKMGDVIVVYSNKVVGSATTQDVSSIADGAAGSSSVLYSALEHRLVQLAFPGRSAWVVPAFEHGVAAQNKELVLELTNDFENDGFVFVPDDPISANLAMPPVTKLNYSLFKRGDRAISAIIVPTQDWAEHSKNDERYSADAAPPDPESVDVMSATYVQHLYMFYQETEKTNLDAVNKPGQRITPFVRKLTMFASAKLAKVKEGEQELAREEELNPRKKGFFSRGKKKNKPAKK